MQKCKCFVCGGISIMSVYRCECCECYKDCDEVGCELHPANESLICVECWMDLTYDQEGE